VGLKDRGQSLHHFLKDAEWKIEDLRETRLWLTKLLIGEREIVLLIDETGDEKKGKTTDYVARQYIGNLGKTETRYIREIIFGRRRTSRYYQISKKDAPDPSGDESWYIMTNLEGQIQKQVGGLYSLRNWIEYGFKQIKDELGWADFRVTDYESIERWWEIVMSAYLLVSLQANYFQLETVCRLKNKSDTPSTSQLSHHPLWEAGTSWKGALNNLRLIIQPYTFYNLLQPWLEVFKIPKFRRCFLELIEQMNQFFGLSSFDFSLFPFMAA
jgi:hypothetical protein